MKEPKSRYRNLAEPLAQKYAKWLNLGASFVEANEAPTATLSVFTSGQQPSIEDFIGGSPLQIGQAGSGKSNGVGVSIEDLIRKRIQQCIIDINGEHEGIVDMFPSKIVRADMSGDGLADAKKFYLDTRSWWFDLSEFSREQYMHYLALFLVELLRIKKEKYKQLKKTDERPKPILFVVEESHNFMPRSFLATDKPGSQIFKDCNMVKSTFKKFAQEARKFGFGLWSISQDLTQLDLTTLRQSRIKILMKVFETNQVKTYMGMIPGAPPFSELKDELAGMKPGECYFIRGSNVSIRRFKMKKSKDAGITPTYADALGWKKGVGIKRDDEQTTTADTTKEIKGDFPKLPNSKTIDEVQNEDESADEEED